MIDVRRAVSGDVPDLVRLALEVQAVHVSGRPDLFKVGGVDSHGVVAQRLGDSTQFYWVARTDGETVGYAYARVVDEPESPWRYAMRVLMLDQMSVDPHHRSRGIGSALWNAVRETAAAERVDRVMLNVWAFNAGARRFYERLGFASFHERMAFELARRGTALGMESFLDLVPGGRGHFRMESGYHTDRWLDLDALFVDSARLAPWIDRLAERIARYDVGGVCGPLTGGAFLAQAIATRLGVAFAFTDRSAPPNDGGMYRVSYPLRPSLARVVRDQRMAIVDDVVSAGSASRGTLSSLVAAGAKPVVVGALLLQGNVAREYFANLDIAVEAVGEDDGALWLPDDCPLCRSGVPVVDRSA